MTGDVTQCPDCGWTGRESALEDHGTEQRCPICDYTVNAA